MIDVNTKTLISFLPFDPAQKLDLLEKYDSLSKDEQIRITRIVWEALADYEELKIKENFEDGLSEAEKDKSGLDQDYYKKIVDKTEKEIDAKLAASQQAEDLTSVRKSMEQIVREINATKKPNPQ